MTFCKHTLRERLTAIKLSTAPLICQFPLTVARQGDVNTAVVSAFVSNAACNNMSVSVTLPQNKGLLLRGLIKPLFIEDDSSECQMSVYESNNYLCIYRVLHLNTITEVGLIFTFYFHFYSNDSYSTCSVRAGYNCRLLVLHNFSHGVAGAVDILNDNKIISGFPCKSGTNKAVFPSRDVPFYLPFTVVSDYIVINERYVVSLNINQ